MGSIGKQLRQERELRGISLQEIAKITKINLHFLTALEEDRLNVLPGEFFIKGIIRSYARSIGMDENYALNIYYQSQQVPEKSPSLSGRKMRASWSRDLRRSLPGILLAAMMAGVLILSILFFVHVKKRSSPSPPGIQKGLAADVLLPSPAKPSSPPALEEAGFHLELTFRDTTWIQVYADGKLVAEGNKQPGEILPLTPRQEVRITLGNAGGMDWTINGQMARPLGQPGEVVREVVITRENFRSFLKGF